MAPRELPQSYFLPFLAFLCLTVLCLAQPVTLIGVDWCMADPFCAVKAVGIFNVLAHRLPFAARALKAPSGSLSSNDPIGTSGTDLNVLLVIPAFDMNVSPCN